MTTTTPDSQTTFTATKAAPAKAQIEHSPLQALRKGIDLAGQKGLFIALPVIFLWFGGMKFTAYEAGAIEGLIANSPFIAFLLNVFSAQTVSNLIGLVELAIAGLIAARFFAPRLAVIGSAGAVLTFLLTFSFFFTTPGVFLADVSGPAISVLPGQFLLKDLALLAASFWVLNDSLKAVGK